MTQEAAADSTLLVVTDNQEQVLAMTLQAQRRLTAVS